MIVSDIISNDSHPFAAIDRFSHNASDHSAALEHALNPFRFIHALLSFLLDVFR